MINYNSPIKIDVLLLDKQSHITWYKIARAYLVNKPLLATAASEDISHGKRIVRKMQVWLRGESSRTTVKF